MNEEAALIEGLIPIWERSADPCCVVDRLCRIHWSNRATGQLLGVRDDLPADLLLRRADPSERSALRRLMEGAPRGETATVWLLLADGRAEIEVQVAMLGSELALLTMHRAGAGAQQEEQARVAELEAALGDIRARLESLGIGSIAPNGDARRLLPSTLTGRQHEVAELLLAGLREDEIAEALYISEHTVRNHKKAAFRVLGVHSMAELLSTYRPSFSLSLTA